MSDFHYHKPTSLETTEPKYMSVEEIKAYKPYSILNDGLSPALRAKKRMVDNGIWEPHQILGRRWGIGCVALEITQRCNLDCTLCYLSENSEAVKDIPLEEIYRRIDVIFQHYGQNTDIQVTGGDPTLRAKPELLDIIRKIRSYGMRPTLMTNGIKASRELLMEMKAAGLEDIAFHVDMTQERKGFKTEAELHKVRKEYIERARGLKISVLFNTTVHKENFHEIPEIIRFFREQGDVVNFASFQLQADTGRGVLRERDFIINQDSVVQQIRIGSGEELRFDVPLIGHQDCNRYATSLLVNGKCFDAFADVEFIRRMVNVTASIEPERGNQAKFAWKVIKTVGSDPRNWIDGIKYLGKMLWRMKWDLIKAKGMIRKQSFFIHNFMGADQLEQCRIDTCSFVVITNEGPISMCLHNAKRDDYILQPVKHKERYWNPLTGLIQDAPYVPSVQEIEVANAQLKKVQLKGTLKEPAMAEGKPS